VDLDKVIKFNVYNERILFLQYTSTDCVIKFGMHVTYGLSIKEPHFDKDAVIMHFCIEFLKRKQ